MQKFSPAVIKELKYYVYIYSDPATDEIFYVGKGKGNRIFQHLQERGDSDKAKYLIDLEKRGIKPRLEIVIHGLEDEKTALRVESSIIDLIGIQNLTNQQNGYKSATFGRMSLEQINALYIKKPVTIDEPAILIRINKAFRYSMSGIELYDATRGQWKLNPKRAKMSTYAFAVYEGIVYEVYEIQDWYKAGATYSAKQAGENMGAIELEMIKGRYEFIGNLAPYPIREKYKFKSVEHYFKRGNSNPIMYLNI